MTRENNINLDFQNFFVIFAEKKLLFLFFKQVLTFSLACGKKFTRMKNNKNYKTDFLIS